MDAVLGWFLILILTGVIGFIGWYQWNSYRTLDQKIELMDSSLVSSPSTRVEKILDAPPGSVIVPYMMVMSPVQNVATPTPVTMPSDDGFSSVRLVDNQPRK